MRPYLGKESLQVELSKGSQRLSLISVDPKPDDQCPHERKAGGSFGYRVDHVKMAAEQSNVVSSWKRQGRVLPGTPQRECNSEIISILVFWSPKL